MHHRTAALLSTCVAVMFMATGAMAANDRALIVAAKAQNWDTVRSLLTQSVDVKRADPDGSTALHWAAHWDKPDVAKLLLQAGADANATNAHGVTPLALACENGSAAVVEVLLNAGADANATQRNGETALMTAARTGNVQAVKALLARGAQPNRASTELGQTALMWATKERHAATVRALIEAGADVSGRSKGGFTALLFAAQQGDIEIARMLIAAGATVNMPSSRSQPLGVAIASGHMPLALLFLEQGADPNGTVGGGLSVLHAAVGAQIFLGGRGSPEGDLEERLQVIQELLKRGANVNARATMTGGKLYGQNFKNGARDELAMGVGGRQGATPFWLAADNGNANAAILRVLLKAGADPTLTTDCGTTPLMVAAGLGFGYNAPDAEERERMIAAVKFLVEEAHVDLNTTNTAGMTALHGAAMVGADPVVEYLIAKGAAPDVQDFKQRTPFRIAEGHKAATDFHEWPRTAELLKQLGANTSLGIPGRIQERERGQLLAPR